jgi:hypothetical protein
MSLRKFLREAIDIVEIAVRLVLVLLIEFGIVESLIVEFRSSIFVLDRVVRGRSRLGCERVRNC